MGNQAAVWEEYRPRKRPLAVLGNGPSMRGFDFRSELTGFDSIGMNAAYRYWESVGWYPDYYICLDLVVGMSHIEAIKEMVVDRANNQIQRFILRSNAVDALLAKGVDCKYVINFDAIRDHPILSDPRVTTGSHAALIGARLGYQVMVLLGVDANYVNFVTGSERRGGNVLEIVEDHENPNYFFDGYQRLGDRYNIPNPTPSLHEIAWQGASEKLAAAEILVINGSPSSRLNCFTKTDFGPVKDQLAAVATARFLHPEGLDVHMPEYGRRDQVAIDEAAVVFDLVGGTHGPHRLMIDVGAHHGSAAKLFVSAGWTAICFEPDPKNRERLRNRFANQSNALIDPRAVTEKGGSDAVLYTSLTSTGISSLHAFHESHVATASVATTDLAEVVSEYGVHEIDFLKVDAEGADFEILRGFPWSKLKPRFILAEFGDSKTLSRGITYRDICALLEGYGYRVYVSEWHPVLQYGTPHSWRRLFVYRRDSASPVADSWGNVLAVRDDVEVSDLIRRFQGRLTRRESMPAKVELPGNDSQETGSSPTITQVGSEQGRKVSQRLQFLGWVVRSVERRRLLALVTFIALCLAALSAVWGSSWVSFAGRLATIGVSAVAVAVVVGQYLLWARRMSPSPESREHRTGNPGQSDRVNPLETGRRVGPPHGPLGDLATLGRWLIGLARRRPLLVSLTLVVAIFLAGAVATGTRAVAQVSGLVMLIAVGLASSMVTIAYGKSRDRAMVDLLLRRISVLSRRIERRLAIEGQLRARLEVLAGQLEERRVSENVLRDRLDGTLHLVDDLSRDFAGLASKLSVQSKRLIEPTGKRSFGSSLSVPPGTQAHLDRHRSVASRLPDDDVAAILRDWVAPLDLDLSASNLHYLAGRVIALERRLHGRLAATVQTQVVRNLCALSVGRHRARLRILEVGTLFGIGTASMRDACFPFVQDIAVTLVDPLNGYYGRGHDLLTGQPVIERVLRENLEISGMPRESVRVFQRLSQDHEVVAQLSEEQFDLIILDGDHSYHGLEADYRNYRPTLSDGGIVVFDDYANPSWPDVTALVDSVVMQDDGLELLGDGFFSAVFRQTARTDITAP